MADSDFIDSSRLVSRDQTNRMDVRKGRRRADCPSAGRRRENQERNLIARLLDPSNALTVFCVALGIVYCLIPLAAYLLLIPEPSFLRLAWLTTLAVSGLLIGSKISLFDKQFGPRAVRVAVPAFAFHATTWLIFLVFVTVTFLTASSIPLVSALQGVSAESLSQERGDFLKGRSGAGIALLYISTFLTNTIAPYSVVLLYAARSRFRHVFAGLFFVFCISFMQKALFLNLVLPLLALFAITKRLPTSSALSVSVGSLIVLLIGTYLSLGETGDGPAAAQGGNYLSAVYAPSNPLDYFAWRAFAVPIFTATDTLVVHAEQFGGTPLLGATSSLIASLFGMERVNIERFVFEHQFGSWNEIANSNAVFITDAFVNFGQLGVVVFACFIGMIFRWFRISRDVGFKSLWPLLAFILFSAPLIGMLLSNGFLYMLFHALFIKIVPSGKSHA